MNKKINIKSRIGEERSRLERQRIEINVNKPDTKLTRHLMHYHTLRGRYVGVTSRHPPSPNQGEDITCSILSGVRVPHCRCSSSCNCGLVSNSNWVGVVGEMLGF